MLLQETFCLVTVHGDEVIIASGTLGSTKEIHRMRKAVIWVAVKELNLSYRNMDIYIYICVYMYLYLIIIVVGVYPYYGTW